MDAPAALIAQWQTVNIRHRMFWGRTLKQGQTLSLTKEAVNGSLLHLSHVSLNPASNPGATTVFINTGDKKFALVTLEKGKRDFQCIDLYFTTSADASFSVMGPGEVNLLGYFEPSDDTPTKTVAEEESEEEEAVQQEQDSDDEDDDDESSEEVAPQKPVTAPAKPAAKPPQSTLKPAPVQDDDDDDDSDDDDSSEEAPTQPVKAAKPVQPVPVPQKKLKPAEGAKPAKPVDGNKPTKPQTAKPAKKPKPQ